METRIGAMGPRLVVAVMASTADLDAAGLPLSGARLLAPNAAVPGTATAVRRSSGASPAPASADAGRLAPGTSARSVKRGIPKGSRRQIATAAVPVMAPRRDAAAVGVLVEADRAVAIPVGEPADGIGNGAQVARKVPVMAMLQSPAVERVRSTCAQRIGDDGERLAALRLEALGWRIVARNLRVSRAEVDILAIDPSGPSSLVLIEVRRRNRRDFGLAEETIDYRKRNALRRAAAELAMRPVLPDGRRLPELPVRVDLIAIDPGPDGRPSIRHHRGIDL